MSYEDYEVHREGLADAAAPDTWTSPIPYVLTSKGVSAALPGTLTPEGKAVADAWAGVRWSAEPEADTWTRSPGVVTFTANPSPSYLASLAAERAAQAERVPEAGS
jgi:hypothetical protein